MTDGSKPDEAPVDLHCAVWTRDQDIDPIGSALRFDRLIAADVAQPWPRDVDLMDELAGTNADPLARVIATVPEPHRPHGVSWWTIGADGSYVGRRAAVDPAEVRTFVLELLESAGTDDDHFNHDSFGRGDERFGNAEDLDAEFYICSHGVRDRCCGAAGTRLALASAQRHDSQPTRASHLGGHRYAPTALALPSGRMWAHLDDDVLDLVLQLEAGDDIEPESLRRHYRGRGTLDARQQVVEAAVAVDRGWAGTDGPAIHAVHEASDDHVSLRWPTSGIAAVAEVVENQTYPVLVCGEPPEIATKSATEYRIDRIDIT